MSVCISGVQPPRTPRSRGEMTPRRRWLFTVAALVLAACGRGDAPAVGARDDFGEPIRAIATRRRIVSLGPSTTELLAALGAADRVVGRSRWDKWPDAVRSIPEVGDAIRPSLERVIALRPDVVILYAATDNRTTRDALARAGVPVVALRIDRIEQYFRAVTLLGTMVAETERADSIVAGLREELDAVRRRTARGSRPSVFIPAWEQPLMTLGSGSFLSELLEIAGARNVYGDRAEPSLTVSMEDVIRRDPDVVLTGPNSARRIRSDPGWQALRAVREGRVAVYDTTLVSQPSTRLGQAARALAALLHP